MKRLGAMMLAMLMLTGCAGGGVQTEVSMTEPGSATEATAAPVEEPAEEPEAMASDSLYVEAVDLPDGFILGADVSSLLAEEASGVVYRDFDGQEQDMLLTLAQGGVNYVRVRVWVDPFDSQGRGYGGGNCTAETAAKIGARAAQYGMKLLVDFHYSDFWADPGKQQAPKAWAGLSIDEKAERIRAYTAESLETIRAAGADVGMVQVGNETTTGICGETDWTKICALFRAGAQAVRAFDPNVLVVIHFTDPQNGGFDWLAQTLSEGGVDYDVFAASYYPFWHGSLENLQGQLSQVAERYGKQVMVAETQWPYTDEDGDDSGNTSDSMSGRGAYPFTVQGQSMEIRDVAAAVAAIPQGIGVFYWEAGWIPVPGQDRQSRSLLWEQYGSGWASSYAGEYDPQDAGRYYGGCACDNMALFDFEGNPLESLKTFALLRTGNGTPPPEEPAQEPDPRTTGPEAVNYLKNSGFEDEDRSMWAITPLTDRDQGDFQVKALDAYSGEVALHFWDSVPVHFQCEQTVTDLPAGTWRVSVQAQGDDTGDDADIHLYVISDGQTYTAPVTLKGWVNWQEALIEHVPCASGTITVGVYVRCRAGGWGTFDDFLLNPEK